MAKIVLLARPPPFIVSEMKPFLEQNGYVPKKLDSLTDVLAESAGASGAIISLAVVSSLGESAEDVFLKLRKSAPRLPVLFAALLDFSKMKSTLERLAKNAGIEITVLGIAAASESHAGLGLPTTFVYIGKDDLTTPARRELASRILRRHFR
ncbi:MAG: hypothetical protein R8K48_05740 [Gallionella sp.]